MTLNLVAFFALLVLGFVLLIRGAHYLVEGASSLARKLRISEIAIGLTVISFGTSAPEFSVNVLAALAEDSEIIFGNIIGSNLVNILLVLGFSTAIYPLKIKESTIWKDIPFSILAIFLFMILANDMVINKLSQNVLTRSDGVILLLFFALFLFYAFKLPRSKEIHGPGIKVLSNTRTFFSILVGILGLGFGGKLVVENAVEIATLLGISRKLIGLTLVAGGTSLPELVTSLVAAFKKKEDMAVGNIIGSNIFNLFFILGFSAFVSPLEYDPVMNIDVGILAICSAILFTTLWLRRKGMVERWIGILFLVIYGGYFYYLIIRQ